MVRREVRRPFTQFLKPGHFYALGTDRFYVSVDMEVLVMYDSYYDKDSIFKRMTFNEETYILIRDFLEKINNNDYDDIENLGMECIIESTGVETKTSYEIWWYDELTDNWLLIYGSIDTYEEAIYLIDSRSDDSIDDKFRIYEKSISISKKLLKEI